MNPEQLEIEKAELIDLLKNNGHEWFKADFLNYETCKKCGFIKREDGKNSPCKGNVKMDLRGEPDDQPE